MSITTAPTTLAVRAINLALAHIGVSKTITSLQDQSREAMTASLIFDHNYRATLRHHVWPFATKYATLDIVTDGGTATAPINGDWQYAYEYPSDCIFARRIVPTGSTGVDLFGTVVANQGAGQTGRAFSEVPTPFRIGRIGDDLVVFCSLNSNVAATPQVCLEYTAIFDCPEELVDELFMSALSWRLASELAPALSRMPQMQARAWGMYLNTLNTAQAVGEREGQQEAPGEAEWINDR